MLDLYKEVVKKKERGYNRAKENKEGYRNKNALQYTEGVSKPKLTTCHPGEDPKIHFAFGT